MFKFTELAMQDYLRRQEILDEMFICAQSEDDLDMIDDMQKRSDKILKILFWYDTNQIIINGDYHKVFDSDVVINLDTDIEFILKTVQNNM